MRPVAWWNTHGFWRGPASRVLARASYTLTARTRTNASSTVDFGFRHGSYRLAGGSVLGIICPTFALVAPQRLQRIGARGAVGRHNPGESSHGDEEDGHRGDRGGIHRTHAEQHGLQQASRHERGAESDTDT